MARRGSFIMRNASSTNLVDSPTSPDGPLAAAGVGKSENPVGLGTRQHGPHLTLKGLDG